jgi:hypothetical protein
MSALLGKMARSRPAFQAWVFLPHKPIALPKRSVVSHPRPQCRGHHSVRTQRILHCWHAEVVFRLAKRNQMSCLGWLPSGMYLKGLLRSLDQRTVLVVVDRMPDGFVERLVDVLIRPQGDGALRPGQKK